MNPCKTVWPAAEQKPVQDAAMLILQNAGITPEEDGANSTEVGTALTKQACDP